MPIIDVNVVEGPNVQASGQHRGTLEFIFDDGRVVRKFVIAADATEWSNLIVDQQPIVETSEQKKDAQANISDSEDIVAVGQASKEQRAIAYLERAHEHEDPYKAFLLLDKFNTFRINNGWTVSQVKTALVAAGMDADLFDVILAEYNELKKPANVLSMENYQSIIAYWADR